MPENAKDFEASIRKLGFKPEDIRLLLVTHAHIDHAGTTAHFKKLSGTKVAIAATSHRRRQDSTRSWQRRNGHDDDSKSRQER